jgi:CRISPR-associated protein Cas1
MKTLRQYRLLTNLKKNRPDLRYALTHAAGALKSMLTDLDTDAVCLASLRGKEGAAAAVYFKAYTQVFAGALNFTDRNRRPQKDPVNACLSLAYTLFYQEAVNALKASGLDPALGCFHELYYGRDSLACDLLEPVRPLIDAWVYILFQQHTLRREDFILDEVCLLQVAGKQRFYEAFRQTVPAFRRLLRRYARFAANIVCQHELTLR